VRAQGPPSEIRRLVTPLARVIDSAWERMHWWIVAMALLYLLSGVTVVKPDEVAVVLRWGRLVGDTPAQQEHGAGLLFAFPRPMDRVVRVQVKRIQEVPISTLAAGPVSPPDDDVLPSSTESLNPITQGYALTGDENILHVDMVARYRVRDAAEWAFYGPKAEDILRVEVTAAMVRSIGEMAVDRVLTEGRKDLIAIATRRAQAGLDMSHSGLELTSLELVLLGPPSALTRDFDAVQSAYIGAETAKKDAQAYAESMVPQARARAEAAVAGAQASTTADLARARGESQAFLALEKEYRANPAVVKERLYRDAVENALSRAAKIRWIPPPGPNGRYNGLRVQIAPSGAGGSKASAGEDDDR
jgi:modulator of FtsH protease HflK